MIGDNCLSYWYPILHNAGLPQPKTHIVRCSELLDCVLEGKIPECWPALMASLEEAAVLVGGYPIFLRTGQGSGKHDYEHTCYVAQASDFPSHVGALVEWSAMVDFLGLPTNIWAVREFLHLDAPFKAFEGMPVARERRYFVRDGQLVCKHNYWPEDAVHGNNLPDDWREQLAQLNQPIDGEDDLLTSMAIMAARALGDAWSIDFTCDRAGKWWLTDCALAAQSFHWPDCPHKDSFGGSQS